MAQANERRPVARERREAPEDRDFGVEARRAEKREELASGHVFAGDPGREARADADEEAPPSHRRPRTQRKPFDFDLFDKVAEASDQTTLGPPVPTGTPKERASAAASKGAWGMVKNLLAHVGRSHTQSLAAEMAFWLFLSLLPLAAVAAMVTAKLATQNSEAFGPLLDSLPTATRELIGRELSQVAAWNGGAVGVFAALTFVWLASSGVSAIFDALSSETEATPRSWFKKRGLAIASCAALSVGVAILAVLGAGLENIVRLTAGAVPFVGETGSSLALVAARFAFGLAVAVALVTGLYYVGIPAATRRKMPLLPGALLAVALQTAFGTAYGFYLSTVGDGSAYQAGLATIAATLMALYLFGIALLVGAELNQLLGARRATCKAGPG